MKRKTRVVKKPFGYQLLLDCYGCNTRAMDSLDACYDFLNQLVVILGMHKQSEPTTVRTDAKKFIDKDGLSCWVALAESHISIHTLTKTGFVTIDVYSCKKYDVEKVKKFTQKVFEPLEIEEHFILRGRKYSQIKKPTKTNKRRKT